MTDISLPDTLGPGLENSVLSVVWWGLIEEKVKLFSQRKGFKPVSAVVQIDSMNDDLRNSIWNALDTAIWQTNKFLWRQHGEGDIQQFSRVLWSNYFKKPADARPDNGFEILREIRDYYFSCGWNEVYDFIEFVVNLYSRSKPNLPDRLNFILNRELSGFRFVGGTLTDIAGEQELEMLQEALADDKFGGVAEHLNRALELYSDRSSPDYRNSIKESISAVESIARIVSNNRRATLGDALKAIEEQGSLHPSLKAGFLKIYGYTNDEGGIRHAILEESNVSSADARYFLLSCTSFVNYLKGMIAS